MSGPRTVLCTAALALAVAGAAQERAAPAVPIEPRPAARTQKSQQELIALRDEKLAKPVFKKAPWVMDYDQALASAKASGKYVFAYFTRSYAH